VTPPFTLSMAATDAGRRLVVTGALDAHTCPRLREPLLAAGRSGRVVLDLSAVTFCDSSGLGLLVEANQVARDSGHELIVARVCSRVLRVLVSTGLDRYLTLDPPVHSAPPQPPGAVTA
jgi:anti-sigma B factor antagonist